MKEVPIWEKANLTLEEAAAYSGIGTGKLREITNDRNCNFVPVSYTHLTRSQLHMDCPAD